MGSSRRAPNVTVQRAGGQKDHTTHRPTVSFYTGRVVFEPRQKKDRWSCGHHPGMQGLESSLARFCVPNGIADQLPAVSVAGGLMLNVSGCGPDLKRTAPA